MATTRRRTKTPPARSKPWILATTIIGSSIAYIDGTVVNVALPVLQQDFGAKLEEVQWVVEAYTLLVASLVLVGGTLGDRFGRRRVYAIGVMIYALASAWCGLAPDIAQLIAARALQGIGGALLIPGSLAIITSSFSKDERGKAIGTWSGLSAVSTAIGPLLGGWLVDTVTWRAVFFINIPLAAIVLFLLFRHVPESSDDKAPDRLDWLGAILAATGLGAFVYGLIEANTRGFSDPIVIATIVAGVILLAAFIVNESRSRTPMMPLHLFSSRDFAGTNLLTLLLYAALNGMFFFLGFNLIQVQGYSAIATGAALLPFIVLISSLSRWAGGLVGKYGARLPLIAGPTVAAAGYALMGFQEGNGSYWTTFFPAIAIIGLGMAITIAPLTSTVMGSVEERHAGTASGINNAVSWMSGLLAIAILGIIASHIFSANLDQRLARLPIPPPLRNDLAAQSSKLAAIEVPPSLPDTLRSQLNESIDDSFIDAFQVVMLVCAGLALAGGVGGGMMVRGKRKS